jgi:hypothetical protein
VDLDPAWVKPEVTQFERHKMIRDYNADSSVGGGNAPMYCRPMLKL